MLKILKYNKRTIYNPIYIKEFSVVTVSYITVSNDDVINTNNNDTVFPELRRVFEEYFDLKFQEGNVLKCLYFLICHYPLGFSVDQNDQIMELVN